MTALRDSSMAQLESKKVCTVRIHLEMVRGPHLDNEENPSESGLKCVVTADECVVDGRGSFLKDKESQVLIQGLHQTTISLENIKHYQRRIAACLKTSTSADITIYYYRSNRLANLGKGIPVVLNISNSDTFLKCTFKENKAVLTVECCAKDKLNFIYENDPTTWPFVFYLSQTKDYCRCFESAQCTGWYIRTESNVVDMDEQKDKDKDFEKISFIISPSHNTTKSK